MGVLENILLILLVHSGATPRVQETFDMAMPFLLLRGFYFDPFLLEHESRTYSILWLTPEKRQEPTSDLQRGEHGFKQPRSHTTYAFRQRPARQETGVRITPIHFFVLNLRALGLHSTLFKRTGPTAPRRKPAKQYPDIEQKHYKKVASLIVPVDTGLTQVSVVRGCRRTYIYLP